jgi:hypothetical protein
MELTAYYFIIRPGGPEEKPRRFTLREFKSHVVASTSSTERNEEYTKRKRVEEEEGRKRTK